VLPTQRHIAGAVEELPPCTVSGMSEHCGAPGERWRVVEEAYEGLAATLDTAAELYEQVRPVYPVELFDDLAALPGPHATAARVLEIGQGRGRRRVDCLPTAGASWRWSPVGSSPEWGC
jgi:hypothetical protein